MPADDESAESAERTESRAYVGEYDELVRDGIPAIVRADGNRPVTRRVDGDEYERYLAAKLREEADEVVEAIGERDEGDGSNGGADDGSKGGGGDPGDGGDADDAVLDEFADVYAVLAATVEARRHSITAVRERARETAEARGGFDDGIVLERIDSPASGDGTGAEDDDTDADRS